MKLVYIEPTPNPNSMKINLDESLAAGIKYTFTQQDQRNYPAYAKKILAIPGVVSLPHGWGHGRPGAKLEIANRQPGASANDLTDERQLDALSGNAALNGVPVEVEAA